MALGFAGGMTSLAWMGLATLMMVMEKLPVAGPRVTAATGWALLAAGAAALAQAVGGLP
jgi:predicted metal-binding membrane protein